MTNGHTQHRPRTGRRRPRAGRTTSALAAAAVLLGAACGDDDETEAVDTTETEAPAPEETTTTEASEEDGTEGAGAGSGDVDLAAFCTGAIEGEALFNVGPELDEQGNPTPEGLQEFSEQFQPILADLEENAPEEIAAEVETLVGALRQAVEQGDQAAVETPEAFTADQAIDQYVFDNCELETSQEIVAVDYAYEGVPETMASGQVGLRMDNQGDEVHEAVIFRINDDVDMSMQELLELPEEEAQTNVEFQGATFAPPGQASSTVVDLEPGRYALICFVPVGTTSMDALESDAPPEGQPHFTQGMVTEFRVE